VHHLIYENFWAGGVKQPLNPSRHPSMDEASSEAGRTVATDSSQKKVVLVHSYGPQNNDKVKESANEVAVLPQKPSARQGC